ncbi:MAG: tetratricopeptide repeat protein [Cyclobacteriaceae bacterium]
MIKIFTKRALLLCCPLLFYSLGPVFSQSYNKELVYAYQKVLDLDFRNGIPTLSKDTYESSDDKVFRIYILNLQNTLDLLLVHNPEKYKSHNRIEKTYNHILGELNNNDPFVNYQKIEMKVHRGLLRIKYGDRLTGAFNLIQAFRNIRSFEEKYPGHIYTLKISGLLNIIISLFPDQYDWVLSMFQIDPDFTKGMNYLKELSETESVYMREGLLIYTLCESFYGNNSNEAVSQLISHKALFDRSLLFNYLIGLSSIKNRSNKRAIGYFDNCLSFGRSYLQIPSINYYRAESYLKELNYSKASYLYNLYLTKPDATLFIKDANYKLYNLSFLFNLPDDDHENYRLKILSEGNLETGADRYAINRITNNYVPDSTLFISRLLFDGGYFERSIEILETGNISDYSKTEDRCEFYYRYARNYQSLSEYEKAIDFYEKVLEISGSEEFYFWGNATLNLGHIYSKRETYSKAREYYKLALKYKGNSYQNSIKAEAKAGLKKISGF